MKTLFAGFLSRPCPMLALPVSLDFCWLCVAFAATFSTWLTASRCRCRSTPLPAVLTQGIDVLNRPLLLLLARIRERFCDRPFGEIERISKTERHEIAGQTSVILDAFLKNLFHLG